MQTFGLTNKEHYGMLWYFPEWSIAMVNLSTNQRVRNRSVTVKTYCDYLFYHVSQGSCNKTVISLGSVGSAGSPVPRSAILQISLTLEFAV